MAVKLLNVNLLEVSKTIQVVGNQFDEMDQRISRQNKLLIKIQ